MRIMLMRKVLMLIILCVICISCATNNVNTTDTDAYSSEYVPAGNIVLDNNVEYYVQYTIEAEDADAAFRNMWEYVNKENVISCAANQIVLNKKIVKYYVNTYGYVFIYDRNNDMPLLIVENDKYNKEVLKNSALISSGILLGAFITDLKINTENKEKGRYKYYFLEKDINRILSMLK